MSTTHESRDVHASLVEVKFKDSRELRETKSFFRGQESPRGDVVRRGSGSYFHDRESYGTAELPPRGAFKDPIRTDHFLYILGFAQIVSIVLFGLFASYETPNEDTGAGASEFVYYNNVAFMMLIGFGYLMSFLRYYPLGAIGFTFLVTVVCVQWGILLDGFWERVYFGDFRHILQVGAFSLVVGNFAAATVLISFGVLIGKIGPAQLMLLALFELCFYSFNYAVVLRWLEAVDIGGSIAIHLFGAVFGVAASWMWGEPSGVERRRADASRSSDIFSLIGTIFLWIYWPSFNGAPAEAGSAQQLRVTVNTVLSLCASVVGTFFASRLLSHGRKFGQADVQNATLAGGVAIGSCANMIVQPWGALVVGLAGGAVSTFGFRVLQDKIEANFGVHDTAGVQNLHGWPALLAAIVSMIVGVAARESDGYDEPKEYSAIFPRGGAQGRYQLYATLLTLLIASTSGVLCAWVVKRCVPRNYGQGYDDGSFWEMDIDMRQKGV